MNKSIINKLAIIHPILNILGAAIVFIAASLTMSWIFPHELLTDLTFIYCNITLLFMIPSGIVLCCFARHIQLLRYVFLVLVTGSSVAGLIAACWMLHFLVH